MLPVAPGEKLLQRRVCLRRRSGVKGAEVGGRRACSTGSSQESKLQWDLQTKALSTLMKVRVWAVFCFLLCCKLSFLFIVLFGSSHFHAKPRPLYDQPLKTAAIFTPVSLFCPFSVFFSTRSKCGLRPALRPSPFLLSFPPFSLPAKRRAWKLNRVASLRSIYANSLHRSEGKTKLDL